MIQALTISSRGDVCKGGDFVKDPTEVSVKALRLPLFDGDAEQSKLGNPLPEGDQIEQHVKPHVQQTENTKLIKMSSLPD